MDIELSGIHKRFGKVHANDNIDLTFKGGRIVGILGENGAGKSTLMKILSGYQPADEGEIRVDGIAVDYHGPQAAIAQGIGMLQQDPLDVPAFTVLENFIYGSAVGGLLPNRRKAREQLGTYTSRFGFDLGPNTPIASLTIAQRQQLEIVRLLALGVKTLILDEPTTGISAEQKETLFEALRELARNDGMIVLLVSHKLEDVISLCDEVAVLRAGRVVGTRDMPATTDELVTMMFGEQIQPAARAEVDLRNAAPVLELDNVTVQGKRLAVENLTIRLRRSEVIGLAGLDGSGQQLAMRAAVGLERPLAGEVVVNGKLMTGEPYRAFGAAGVCFGAAGRVEEGLIAGLTLTEHVALVNTHGRVVDWRAALQACEAQIRRYNVRGRPNDPIQALSGGNQQRMLMALMPEEPVAMILEQPTRGLDVDSARWIWQQLLARRARGTAILFSSPDLDEILNYSDRVFVFYAGRAYEVPDTHQTDTDELGRLIGGEWAKQKQEGRAE